jgi:hypothetical protein
MRSSLHVIGLAAGSLLFSVVVAAQQQGGGAPAPAAPAAQSGQQGRGGQAPQGGGRAGQGQDAQGGVQNVVGGGQAGQQQGGGGRQGGGRGGRGAAPQTPAPRNAQGRVMLGGKGVWTPAGFGITTPLLATEQTPYQPWAKALYEFRQTNELEPHTRCKPSGFSRQFLTPYGVEFVELPELQRIYIFDIGGPHTFRTVFMDGRTHPHKPVKDYYGHSIGWWEGDTLVVDSVGFNESFWMDRRGMPHTDQLHTLEKFTRVSKEQIRYEVTVDDPGVYTKAWSSGLNLGWQDGQELFEYVCQQSNYAGELMVGEGTSADRSSPIVP